MFLMLALAKELKVDLPNDSRAEILSCATATTGYTADR